MNVIARTIAAFILAALETSAATHYVSLGSANPTPPYTNWATAATNIQDGVNVAVTDDVVMVSNGIYPGGVTVTKPLTLLSVNGPQFTVINGGGSNQCLLLSDGASLTGFTLTGSSVHGVYCTSTNVFLTNCTLTRNTYYAGQGVGVYSGTLYNCTLSSNWAFEGGGAFASTLYNCTLTGNSATNGGGASGCTLYNCTLASNSAVSGFDPFGDYFYGGYGGGAAGCTLYNCTLTGNSARYGGGASASTLYNGTLTANSASAPLHDVSGGVGGGLFMGTLNNCVDYLNTASGGANYDYFGLSTLNHCCTTPLPTMGVGNITNDPLFVDYTHGNLHLQSDSPCINSGNNAYVSSATDLDGNPRIMSDTVDIGAYEYQGNGSRISYAWLQQYGLPTDSSADFIDSDGDGMNNWQEWVCGTDPTNAASVLKMLSPKGGASGMDVPWLSVTNRNYFLQRATKFALQEPFLTVATNVAGQVGITTFTDTNAAGGGPFFYRVGIKYP